MRRVTVAAIIATAIVVTMLAGVAFKETATLNASNGYRFEKKFRAQGAVTVSVALEPEDAPVDAFLYLGGGDEPVARASGRKMLKLQAAAPGAYTLALVGARRVNVTASIEAGSP